MIKSLSLTLHGKKQSHATSMRLLYGSFSNLSLHYLKRRNYGAPEIATDFNMYLNSVLQMKLFAIIFISPN